MNIPLPKFFLSKCADVDPHTKNTRYEPFNELITASDKPIFASLYFGYRIEGVPMSFTLQIVQVDEDGGVVPLTAIGSYSIDPGMNTISGSVFIGNNIEADFGASIFRLQINGISVEECDLTVNRGTPGTDDVYKWHLKVQG